MACALQGCDTHAHAKGWCKKHYLRWRRHGDPTVTLHKPHAPKGEGHLAKDGYVRKTVGGVRDAEHRMVMAEFLDRPLHPEEEVHHKNLQRADNRIENLELWSGSQPSGARVQDLLAWAHELIERYADEELPR